MSELSRILDLHYIQCTKAYLLYREFVDKWELYGMGMVDMTGIEVWNVRTYIVYENLLVWDVFT